IYRNLNDFAKSGEMYEKAREYSLAGSMFREAGQFERAGAAFEKAKQYDEAIELYKQAGNDARQVGLFEKVGRYYEAPENYPRRGLIENALSMIEKIPKDPPDYSQACSLHGKILLAQGDIEAAKRKLEEAVISIPNISQTNLATLIDLAKETGQLSEGSQVLQ